MFYYLRAITLSLTAALVLSGSGAAWAHDARLKRDRSESGMPPLTTPFERRVQNSVERNQALLELMTLQNAASPAADPGSAKDPKN